MERMKLRSLLSWDMGLGKTVATNAVFYRNPQTLPAVVVCPASVKYQWEAEAAKFGIRSTVAEGRKPPNRNGRLLGSEKLLIINYDILPQWVDSLSSVGLRTIVIDECQMLGNPQSNRTKATVRLARPMKYAIGLSGTPLTNRPAEMWSTLNILRPDLFGSFWHYACDFCDPKFIRGEWQYKGATNLDELNRQLQPVMIRRRKRDVLADLPPLRRRIVPVPIRNPAEYREAHDDFLAWIKRTDPAHWRSAARAEQMTRPGYLLRLTARLKMRAVIKWANDFLEQGDEKLVLFAYHKKAIDALKRKCRAKSVVIDGSVTGRKRTAAKDQFRRDPNTRLLIGNLKACGTGVDGLQEVCSTAGICELWWVPGAFLQLEGRLERIGQKHQIDMVYLVAQGTIEERLCQVLQDKQQVIAKTLDGEDAVDDLNLFDELVSIMKTEKQESTGGVAVHQPGKIPGKAGSTPARCFYVFTKNDLVQKTPEPPK